MLKHSEECREHAKSRPGSCTCGAVEHLYEIKKDRPADEKRLLTEDELLRAEQTFHEEDHPPASQGRLIALAVNTIRRLQFELRAGDHWMKRAKRAQENGTCPVCFASDEAGHREGCAWGEDVQRVEALMDIAQSIPLLTQVQRYLPAAKRDKDSQQVECTHCLYCGEVIDRGNCGNHENADPDVVVTGHTDDCLYKRALTATGRRF